MKQEYSLGNGLIVNKTVYDYANYLLNEYKGEQPKVKETEATEVVDDA